MTSDDEALAVYAAVVESMRPVYDLLERLMGVVESQARRLEVCELELQHLRPARDGDRP